MTRRVRRRPRSEWRIEAWLWQCREDQRLVATVPAVGREVNWPAGCGVVLRVALPIGAVAANVYRSVLVRERVRLHRYAPHGALLSPREGHP